MHCTFKEIDSLIESFGQTPPFVVKTSVHTACQLMLIGFVETAEDIHSHV
jgi:hypothetical protein